MRRCDRGGAHCAIFRGSPGGDDYHSIWINPKDAGHMAEGSDQGAAITVNGSRTWSSWYNQPTGQFYHLAADNRFPYWVYSGQQDSGTVAIASRSDYGALDLRDWHPVGGDERDYDIPDPVDPNIVYGSGLGGRVSRWDARTGEVTDVSPWPVQNYGLRPTTRRAPFQLGDAARRLARRAASALPWRRRHLQDQRPRRQLVDHQPRSHRQARRRDKIATATSRSRPRCPAATAPSLRSSRRRIRQREIWVGSDTGILSITRDGGANWTQTDASGHRAVEQDLEHRPLGARPHDRLCCGRRPPHRRLAPACLPHP